MKHCLVFILMLFGFFGFAQKARPAIGITTQTNTSLIGGVVVRFTKELPRTGRAMYRYTNFEFVNIKHPKEQRLNSLFGTGSAFVNGKANYLFSLRGQYGRGIVLMNPQSTEGGLTLSAIGGVGVSLGLSKPYYIQFVPPGTRSILKEAYDPINRHKDINAISGAASPFLGLGRTRFHPGANLRAGIVLAYQLAQQRSIGVEVGGQFEYLSGNPVILPQAGTNSDTFSTGYLTLFYGLGR